MDGKKAFHLRGSNKYQCKFTYDSIDLWMGLRCSDFEELSDFAFVFLCV